MRYCASDVHHSSVHSAVYVNDNVYFDTVDQCVTRTLSSRVAFTYDIVLWNCCWLVYLLLRCAPDSIYVLHV